MVKALINRLRHKFNVSIAEVDANNLWQRATLGMAVANENSGYANKILNKIIDTIENDGNVQILDKNFALGNIILPVSMALLQYCPSPQRYASDYQPPNYTLWYLEPHCRMSWLQALLIILYKVYVQSVYNPFSTSTGPYYVTM